MENERSAHPISPRLLEGLCASMASAGCRAVARVFESDSAFDFAFALPDDDYAVIRCVPHAKTTDYRALRTMLQEGDFDRAVLVYCDEEQPHLSNEIESWPISRIEELARRLAGGKHHE
jgi:hypothetical protein